MLAVHLRPDLEQRLTRLAAQTGQTPESLAAVAIGLHLEGLEDYYLAAEDSQHPGRIYSADEAKRPLSL